MFPEVFFNRLVEHIGPIAWQAVPQLSTTKLIQKSMGLRWGQEGEYAPRLLNFHSKRKGSQRITRGFKRAQQRPKHEPQDDPKHNSSVSFSFPFSRCTWRANSKHQVCKPLGMALRKITSWAWPCRISSFCCTSVRLPASRLEMPHWLWLCDVPISKTSFMSLVFVSRESHTHQSNNAWHHRFFSHFLHFL